VPSFVTDNETDTVSGFGAICCLASRSANIAARLIVTGSGASHYGCGTYLQGGSAACRMSRHLSRKVAESVVLEPIPEVQQASLRLMPSQRKSPTSKL